MNGIENNVKEKKNFKILKVLLIIFVMIGIIIGAFLVGKNYQINKGETIEKENFNTIVAVIDELRNEDNIDISLNSIIMEELTKLYNQNPNNFNKDTAYQYLLSNGLIVRGKSNEENFNINQTKISDTEIRELIQEKWTKSNKNVYKASISKIEKEEDDGKGRYIYIIYWSKVNYDTEFGGWSEYQYVETERNGTIRMATLYGVDTNNTLEESNIIAVETRQENVYKALQEMKKKEEFYWNIDVNSKEYKDKEENVKKSQNTNIKADIETRLNFFNNYHKLGFNPTDEQMDEIINYYLNNKDTFDNDTLMKFITDKGWVKK